MELILWRHAEAEDGFPDNERKLTGKGEKQAAAMAAWLKPRLPEDCRVLASPARRTRQTAQALTADFEILAAIAPGASAEAVLGAAGWPNAGGTVLVVGHQPTLGAVAALLLADCRDSWSVKKGGVWWFSRRAREEGNRTALKLVIAPESL